MVSKSFRQSVPAWSASLIAAVAVGSASAVPVTIVDDSFADGDLAKTGALDTNWYYSSSSSALEIAPGELGLVTGTSGRGMHTIFAPQSLDDIGDQLIVTYSFTTPDTVGNRSTGFRVGLFDSLGRAGLDADVPSSSGSPNDLFGWGLAAGGPGTQTLPGFLHDIDVNNGPDSDLNFREHTVNTISGTGRLMSTTTGFANVSPSGPDEGDFWAANTAYDGTLVVQRISATEFEYTATLNGITHSVVDSTIDSDSFDMLAFHMNSRTFGSSNTQGEADNGLDFSNISVTFDVPEPASAMLLGLGGLAFLRRRP
ncbi:MAG: PEP-CTERM sorting domain-containing protein [Planctomycetota bacterium]